MRSQLELKCKRSAEVTSCIRSGLYSFFLKEPNKPETKITSLLDLFLRIFRQAPADDSHNRKPQFASILIVTRVLIIQSRQVMISVLCSGKHGSTVPCT